MISLKRYLNRHEDHTDARQVVSLFLESIASSAAIAGPEEYEVFRSEIDKIRNRVASGTAREPLLSSVASATQTLENYNKRVTDFLAAQGKEMQTIVGMMATTIANIGGATTRSADRLAEIGGRLENVSSAKDLAAIESRLSECLVSFKEETLRQKASAGKIIDNLREEIELNRERGAGLDLRDVDAPTGLPKQNACLQAMQAAVEEGKIVFAAIIVINRLQSINSRFGRRAGDRMLHVFGKFVEQRLAPGDRLFRWNGPAVVALFQSAGSLEGARSQIERMLETRIEETFESEARAVLISPAWSVFTLGTTVSAVETQINSFVATQGT
jgi:GGDEF domain-containing protein